MTDRRQKTDRQTTDHATETCVGTNEIACAARAIPPNNHSKVSNAKKLICEHESIKQLEERRLTGVGRA